MAKDFNYWYCNDAGMWSDEVPHELCDGVGCSGCEHSSGYHSKRDKQMNDCIDAGHLCYRENCEGCEVKETIQN